MTEPIYKIGSVVKSTGILDPCNYNKGLICKAKFYFPYWIYKIISMDGIETSWWWENEIKDYWEIIYEPKD